MAACRPCGCQGLLYRVLRPGREEGAERKYDHSLVSVPGEPRRRPLAGIGTADSTQAMRGPINARTIYSIFFLICERAKMRSVKKSPATAVYHGHRAFARCECCDSNAEKVKICCSTSTLLTR